MILRIRRLAIGAAILSSVPSTFAIAPSDIPSDTPVSQLISSANTAFAAGNAQDALTYFDIAISRDPQNYMTIFRRGATYLSLGKYTQAHQDFDKVLAIKPSFENALVQRAKIYGRNGDWSDAKKDYEAAGKKGGEEIAALEEAEGAARLAAEAASKKDWENCVSHASTAIMTASGAPDLRKLRANCRLEKGELPEALSDLQHLLQISSGSTDPHLQISAMSFYSLGETDKGLGQINKCLQSDPDSKVCMRLRKKEKALEKQLKKVDQFFEKRQFNSATKLLIPTGEEPGLLKDVQDDSKRYREEGMIHPKAPEDLYNNLLEKTCEAFVEMDNHKKAQLYCTEALSVSPQSLYGLLAKAQRQLDADDFELAMHTLNEAKEHHQHSQKLQQMLQNAQTLLKRSKQKDYYKVLGVPRDADERDIKKAYRRLTVKFHPDKASAQGFTKEEAEKKMASINEAYEVLSDPELKARFDRGDDPNNPQQGPQFQGAPFGHGGQRQFVFQTGPGGFAFPGGGNFKFDFGGGGGFPGF